MELFHIFKKKLPKKKVVWCIGIPYTYDSFIICCRKKEKSDFIESLELKYNTTDEELLWNFFKTTADNIAKTKSYLTRMNVTVVELSCIEQLREVFNFETVILTAHRHRYFDCLDLLGNSIEIDDLVKEIPENFDGIMDISSCYSSEFQNTCKKRAVFATYIAAETESSLDLRLFIYKQTIRHLASHKDNNYLKSFRVILSRMIETGFINHDRTGTVFLGGKKTSLWSRNSNISVFSQKEARIGDTFMIQVYGYNHDKRHSIISHAKKVDSYSSERDSIPLNVELNEGDNITLSMSVFNLPELSQTKTLCWTKSIARTHFFISVPSEYKNQKMFLEILVTTIVR